MNIRQIIREEIDDISWIQGVAPKWDISNIHLVAGKKFYVADFPPPKYTTYQFQDEIRPKPNKNFRIPMPGIKVCWEEKRNKYSPNKCNTIPRWRTVELLNDGTWILMDGEPITESNDLDWIKDEELPILPYIGKRFKLVFDNGDDSGRRYQILEYYFDDDYNKDFYVKTVLLNPNTLEPETKNFGLTQGQIFHSPMSRAMELINNGNWVFLDTINESQGEFDWVEDPDIPLRPYVGEEYVWKGWGDNKRSLRFGTKISDFIRIIRVDEPPLTTIHFLSADDNYVRDMTNIKKWDRLIRSGEIVPVKGMGINESEKILESLFNKLSILTEDGKTEPDMEWDFTKGELDKSKRWVKTKEDVKKYLNLLLQKIKNLPKKIRLKILKYVIFSFISLIGLKEINNLSQELPSEDLQLVMKQVKTPTVDSLRLKKIPEVKKEIRNYSNSLIDLIKDEEGLRLVAYNLGDRMVTIGYGHAERIGKTDLKPNVTKITEKEAEELLKTDLESSKDALNRILDSWEKKGIDVEITQGMYDAMTSMIYNMGIGNFRKSDFIQMVKKGEIDKASEEIKQTSSNLFNKYPGLKKRRNKEYELFLS